METISMLMIFELAKIIDIEISLIKTCIHCLRAYTLKMTNPQLAWHLLWLANNCTKELHDWFYFYFSLASYFMNSTPLWLTENDNS